MIGTSSCLQVASHQLIRTSFSFLVSSPSIVDLLDFLLEVVDVFVLLDAVDFFDFLLDAMDWALQLGAFDELVFPMLLGIV